jgi:MOSC domain-containing protein
MPVVGRVCEVWRYPVKSMGGERLERCTVGPRGIPGDRGWALRDEKAGEIRGAKKLPELLRCTARYLEEPAGRNTPPAEIMLPDGTRVRSGDAAAAERLSALVGRPVSLWPVQPETATDHYRRGLPDNPDLMVELRELFGRTPDEPLPDLSVFPPELMQYTSPLGTYFDAFPLHILTTASLAALAARAPAARFDVRRFRPNFLIECPRSSTGLVENEWGGQTLRVGSVRLQVEMPCVRCVMTTLPQGDLPKDPRVLRTIVKEAAQNLGVYATVLTAGGVSVGDEVEIGA